jgi:hypothetical protein
MRRLLIATIAVGALLVSACNDPIRMVTSENRPQLIDEADTFEYQAFDLDNVHDTLRWTWFNTGIMASVTHHSFIPHGDTLLSVRDADGAVVYQNPLQSPEDSELVKSTHVGRPGTWTIELNLYGVDGGRIDFKLARKDVVP